MGDLSNRIKEYSNILKKEPKETKETKFVQTQNSDHITIGGRPVDLFALCDFQIWKHCDITSYMRIHKLRITEATKNQAKSQFRIKSMNMKTFLLIALAVGGLIAGTILVLFLPEIMSFFRSMLGSFGGIMLLFRKKSIIDEETDKTKKIMKKVRKFINK